MAAVAHAKHHPQRRQRFPGPALGLQRHLSHQHRPCLRFSRPARGTRRSFSLQRNRDADAYVLMKFQSPNSKHQRNSNLQTPKRRLARVCSSVMIGAWCFFGTWDLAFGTSEEGYGPPISVPVERSTTTRAHLPPRNWIDQTQAEADTKSIGCLQCHQGVEPMHKAEQNVVLGCTDCHGGNPV